MFQASAGIKYANAGIKYAKLPSHLSAEPASYFPPNTPPDQSNIAVLPSPKNAEPGVQPWTILQ
jgi:hypothetical protein